MIDGQRGHLFPWAPVAFGTGAAFYFALPFEPVLTHYLYVAAIGAAAVLFNWFARGVGPLMLSVFLIGAGMIWAGYMAHQSAAPVLKYRYYGPIEGRVVAIDRSFSGKTRLTLDQVVLDRIAPFDRPVRVRVALHGDQPFLKPAPGQRVGMTGHLSPPSGPVEPGGFDFQRKAWFDRLGAVGYTRVPALLMESAKTDSFALRLYKLRRDIATGFKERIDGKEGPFAAAILTGDRADLDEPSVEALRASNLAHLLAISGLHMGLLTGVVFAALRVGLALVPGQALRWEAKKIAAVCALVVAFAYLGISGASVATQRAFVMVSVMLVAICLDRRALTLRAVAIAALIVLIISPDSVTGPGFQMSFAATTALVAVFAWLRDHDVLRGFPRWFRPVLTLLISSFVAGLATAPFGAAHFNQVAQYGLVANLLSVPMMGLVVMPGAVLATVLWPLGIEHLGLELMRLGLGWILAVADAVAAQNGSVRLIASPDRMVLSLVAFGGLILCLWQGSGRACGAGIVVIASMVWAQTGRPDLLISDTGRLIGVMSSEGRLLNKPRGDGFTAQGWLENDGDPVTQELAADRSGFDANYAEFLVGRHKVIFDAGKDLTSSEVAGRCRAADFVILPRYTETPPCYAITGKTLKNQGSVAVNDAGAVLSVETSNGVRGRRLWVR